MKSSKIFTIIVMAILAGMAVHVLAQDEAQLENQEHLPNFIMFVGKIEEIRKPIISDAGYNKIILAIDDEGAEIAFLITDDTYFVTDKNPEAGDAITGFYDGKAPMALIYPPQPEAKVIAIGLEEDKFIKVDRFDEELVSEDGQLKLNIGPDTQIILQNNEVFEGELANRALVVIYSVTTRSIPAQTTPDKIIVLYEKAVHPIHNLTDEEIASLNNEAGYTFTKEELIELAKASLNLAVELRDNKLEGPKPYVNENGVFMLPVRAVAEAMGLKVLWFGDTRTVQVGKTASFTIGKDSYAKSRMAPVELGTVPVIKNGFAYVPLDFFTILIGDIEVSYKPDAINLHYSVQD